MPLPDNILKPFVDSLLPVRKNFMVPVLIRSIYSGVSIPEIVKGVNVVLIFKLKR